MGIKAKGENSMSVLDKLTRVIASRPQGGKGDRVKGIYHQWKDGSNFIRLAGEFLEVRTHFLAPVNTPKRKDRGLCPTSAFQGDDKLPQVINCPDWDVEKERPKKEKVCGICKLNKITKAVLADKPSDEEKKFFYALKGSTRDTSALKWNIIDRDDPFVLVGEEGQEKKELGYKIASIGPEARNDIEGIYRQVGYDLNDPDRGIDLEIIKDTKGLRTAYSARAVISGTSLKVTPLTTEERALTLYDLKVLCGRRVDPQKVIDCLHDDLRQLLEQFKDADVDNQGAEAAISDAVEEVAEPAPKQEPAKSPSSILSKAKLSSTPAKSEEALGSDDDDDILAGDSKKK